MNLFIKTILICFLLLGVGNSTLYVEGIIETDNIIEEGKTIATRFIPPETYERSLFDTNSFAIYLRHLSLKPHGTKVHYYDGREKGDSSVAAAVIDMTVGEKDLQQCADAVMRLRAEYLRKSSRENEISFNFTNGSPALWSKWRDGYRCVVEGNLVYWVKKSAYSDSDAAFEEYLETVFIYAGSLSLEEELIPANVYFIQPGNVFIQGGSPGHAVIVVDVATNDRGELLFMLAQSFMPAQDIHILVNPNDPDISPWYRLDEGERLFTPEWTFEAGSLKKFP